MSDNPSGRVTFSMNRTPLLTVSRRLRCTLCGERKAPRGWSRMRPPTGERWTHEVKWDGYRFQVAKIGREVRLFSRNGADWTERMPRQCRPRVGSVSV
jgi:hypothetical protein